MTTKITIEVPPHDYAVRVGIEHENNADIEIKHIGPGETWTAYIHNGMRIIEISEVKIGEVKIGRTHMGKLGAPVLVAVDPDYGKLRQSGVV